MRFIRARASDWHADNPNVRPGLWIASIIGVGALYVVLLGLAGHFINGNGSPFLS